VYNGGNVTGLATSVSAALVSAGYKAGAVDNATAQSEPVRSATQVFYGAGAAANGAKIAKYFGVTATAAAALPSGHAEILLGSDTTVPAGLGSSASGSGAQSSSPATSTSPSAAPSSTANNGQAGGAVTVKANAPYGIPCVD
jgi:hypothetical protein